MVSKPKILLAIEDSKIIGSVRHTATNDSRVSEEDRDFVSTILEKDEVTRLESLKLLDFAAIVAKHYEIEPAEAILKWIAKAASSKHTAIASNDIFELGNFFNDSALIYEIGKYEDEEAARVAYIAAQTKYEELQIRRNPQTALLRRAGLSSGN